MLESLSITNFVIVDQLELNFPWWLYCAYRRNGSRKVNSYRCTIISVWEAEAETGIVRNGCDKSEISATFNIVQ